MYSFRTLLVSYRGGSAKTASKPFPRKLGTTLGGFRTRRFNLWQDTPENLWSFFISRIRSFGTGTDTGVQFSVPFVLSVPSVPSVPSVASVASVLAVFPPLGTKDGTGTGRTED